MAHRHKWTVYSTVIQGGFILVKCDCGLRGLIEKPTRKEWREAFRAPSAPYLWCGGNHRVTNISR